jgi:hypothetical protein
MFRHLVVTGRSRLALYVARIPATMYGNAANPGVSYSYHRLVCGDW